MINQICFYKQKLNFGLYSHVKWNFWWIFQLYETGQEHHHVSKAEQIDILCKVSVPINLRNDIWSMIHPLSKLLLI